MLKRFFRSTSSTDFKTRSANRDSETDQQAVFSVARAIDLALQGAETERAGLKRRLDDVIASAALAGGNEIEEYHARPDARSQMLHKSDDEIRNGEERLRTLESNIAGFRLLRADLQKHFPDVNTDPPARH
ncbi:MAG: hypothetical protein JWP84_413 [Tardiphaga sp.]|nr:hypothetical protein [Tardiphaga sp.]